MNIEETQKILDKAQEFLALGAALLAILPSSKSTKPSQEENEWWNAFEERCRQTGGNSQ